MTVPTPATLLQTLTRARLVELGRALEVDVPPGGLKSEQIDALVASGAELAGLLGHLGRDELRAACRAHDLLDSDRSRWDLATRLLEAAGGGELPASLFGIQENNGHQPREGDIVRVRLRQWVVESVAPGEDSGTYRGLTRVRLAGLDDDNQGRPLEVLWELELGAQVVSPETHGLGTVERLDPPRHFAAYLHALQWGAVTATKARLFQAPFRAGIQLLDHQLLPLRKALELPRANLFIADDVGLGKTIEAGLVLQELRLRQRVDFVLVVCPASICLQWRDEMERRFGLTFDLYNRAFVARRWRERGFGVNPWATSNRLVISYSTLRRPEHLEPLLHHLGDQRIPKSLLILDEAHTVAPASAQRYAVDSQITRVVRHLTPRFENRLFLSATPHNGHSNSFSALLELLDPQRFTRGVPVTGASGQRKLDAVMVRRLKEDLREAGYDTSFPERWIVQVSLEHRAEGGWQAREIAHGPRSQVRTSDPRGVGDTEPVELELSRLLGEYGGLVAPDRRSRGRLALIRLQKRLLSSVAAFGSTLELHAETVARHREEKERQARLELAEAVETEAVDPIEDEYGEDDAREEAERSEVRSASAALDAPGGRARELLDTMLALARRHAHEPDAKVLALLDWIRRHQCPGVGFASDKRNLPPEERRWSGRRVLVFTEYRDTLRWLRELLRTAFAGTDRADERILELRGGMGDEDREEIQRAFNSPPDDHPVRVLLATESAREGINLQGHCADLFHFDIPWNPARMEQRNGRIDRTMQPEREVRCRYFVYPQRKEDRVLEVLVSKVETIRRELGSLGAVVLGRLSEVMDHGIGATTLGELEGAESLGGRRETVTRELEPNRQDVARIRREIEEADRMLNASRKVMDFEPTLLRDAIDVGLELAGADPLEPAEPPKDDPHLEAFRLPELPAGWHTVVDSLRPPRERDEEIWEWRRRPPRPVVFRAPSRLAGTHVHLHLEHPFVQRVLDRFRAQGFHRHDLSRVTVVRNPHDALARVVAFARLSLFGPGAARLHDTLVSLAAPWLETRGPTHLQPFAETADRRALDRLEELLQRSPGLGRVSPEVQRRLADSAAEDWAALWPHLEAEAEARGHEAQRLLTARGETEAADLREILESQRQAIERGLGDSEQLLLKFQDLEDTAQQRRESRQLEDDRRHMGRRLEEIDREIDTEPDKLRELYRVVTHRLEPVGLVYLWPETRA